MFTKTVLIIELLKWFVYTSFSDPKGNIFEGKTTNQYSARINFAIG